jgi:N-acylneuraminate cytidylyltransferase
MAPEAAPDILAIIPARGGSKGILNKNIRPLAGKPLIVHTIEHALAARAVTRVIVSTDSAAIAEISRAAGAEVVDRPAAISGDTASTESALSHALDSLEQRERYKPELVILLQCTSPLRREDDIDRAVARLRETGVDSLLSLVPFSHFLWKVDAQGVPQAHSYDHQDRPRRQDYTAGMFVENGSIYIFKPWVLRTYGNRLGGRMTYYEMEPLASQEIDTPEEFALCEALLAGPWQQTAPR